MTRATTPDYIGVLATYGYDDLGRRTSLTYGNGVATSYGYDPVSRLTSLTHNLTGTANDLSLGFGYNPASAITATTCRRPISAWRSPRLTPISTS